MISSADAEAKSTKDQHATRTEVSKSKFNHFVPPSLAPIPISHTPVDAGESVTNGDNTGSANTDLSIDTLSRHADATVITPKKPAPTVNPKAPNDSPSSCTVESATIGRALVFVEKTVTEKGTLESIKSSIIDSDDTHNESAASLIDDPRDGTDVSIADNDVLNNSETPIQNDKVTKDTEGQAVTKNRCDKVGVTTTKDLIFEPTEAATAYDNPFEHIHTLVADKILPDCNGLRATCDYKSPRDSQTSVNNSLYGITSTITVVEHSHKSETPSNYQKSNNDSQGSNMDESPSRCDEELRIIIGAGQVMFSKISPVALDANLTSFAYSKISPYSALIQEAYNQYPEKKNVDIPLKIGHAYGGTRSMWRATHLWECGILPNIGSPIMDKDIFGTLLSWVEKLHEMNITSPADSLKTFPLPEIKKNENSKSHLINLARLYWGSKHLEFKPPIQWEGELRSLLLDAIDDIETRSGGEAFRAVDFMFIWGALQGVDDEVVDKMLAKYNEVLDCQKTPFGLWEQVQDGLELKERCKVVKANAGRIQRNKSYTQASGSCSSVVNQASAPHITIQSSIKGSGNSGHGRDARRAHGSGPARPALPNQWWK